MIMLQFLLLHFLYLYWSFLFLIEKEGLKDRTATFLVKMKAHRGEPANEGADILVDKAISDPKVDKEWC